MPSELPLEGLAPHEARGDGFAHDRGKEKTKHEWLTPPSLLKMLGEFDLDPCAVAQANRPWPTATEHYDAEANGLLRPWRGRVFCNPPYDNVIAGQFLGRCAEHGNAIVLIFARTETENWQRLVFPKADAILFIAGRLVFHNADGAPALNTAGAPSALVAYGKENARQLRQRCGSGQVTGVCCRNKGWRNSG